MKTSFFRFLVAGRGRSRSRSTTWNFSKRANYALLTQRYCWVKRKYKN